MMDTDATGKVALDHAWNWFNLHAGQRMQTFNFFLIATAFLIAAYASLLEKLPLAALAVALIGAWIAFWFTRLDNRTRQLIDAGEDVLKACQESLAKSTNIPALEILRKVEKPTPDASLSGQSCLLFCFWPHTQAIVIRCRSSKITKNPKVDWWRGLGFRRDIKCLALRNTGNSKRPGISPGPSHSHVA